MVHQAALELLEMGAQNVLVSLGGEGALWVSERGAMLPGDSGAGAVHRWRWRRKWSAV